MTSGCVMNSLSVWIFEEISTVESKQEDFD